MAPGDHDVAAAVAALAARLPEPLVPLAQLAYNYRWSWEPDGDATFAALDPDRWERVGANPVRQLLDVPAARLAETASDGDFLRRVTGLAAVVDGSPPAR